MKSEELVKVLNREVIEGNLELYKNLLNTTTEAKDPIWKGIAYLFSEEWDYL